jgi:hypothetical protein
MGTVASSVADGGELVEEYDIKTGELLGMWWNHTAGNQCTIVPAIATCCAW